MRNVTLALVALVAVVAALDAPPAAFAAPGGDQVYWAEFGTGKIQRNNFAGSGLEELHSGLSGPIGLALDLGAGKVYWTEETSQRIMRAGMEGDLPGTGDDPEVLVSSVQAGYIALDPEGGKMYWTEGAKVRRADTAATSHIPEDVVTGQSCPLGIALDLDAEAGKVYWTDPCLPAIKRANLNGSTVQTLVSTGLSGPGGIALDTFAGKMYWVDTTDDLLKRANLDGTSVETLIASGLSSPQDVAVDPIAGKVYWTESGTNKVRRANLDGSSVQDVTATGATPFGLDLDLFTPQPGLTDVAIDAAAGKMYFTDFATLIQGGQPVSRIRRANLDGSGLETLLTFPDPSPDGVPVSIDLDAAAGKMYWASRGAIYRASLSGANPELIQPIPCTGTVAVDGVNDYLYYTTSDGKVWRSNFDGTGATVIFLITGAVPRDIMLDKPGGKIYWSQHEGIMLTESGAAGAAAATARVRRANLNGTSPETLVTVPNPSPGGFVGIALDVAAGKMYVTVPDPTPTGSIRRYNLNGSGEEVLVTGLTAPRNISLDTGGGKMYWTDGLGIQRANLNGTSQQLIIAAGSVGGIAGLPEVSSGGGGGGRDAWYGIGALAALALAGAAWAARRRKTGAM